MAKIKEVHVVGLVRLVKRHDRWHAHYQDPDDPFPAGRRRTSLKVKNLRVATDKAKEIDELLQTGRVELLRRRQGEHKGETFGQFVDEVFLKQYPRWSDTTKKYCMWIVELLKGEFGQRSLIRITGDDMETFLSQTGEKKRRQANRLRRPIRSVIWYVSGSRGPDRGGQASAANLVGGLPIATTYPSVGIGPVWWPS